MGISFGGFWVGGIGGLDGLEVGGGGAGEEKEEGAASIYVVFFNDALEAIVGCLDGNCE